MSEEPEIISISTPYGSWELPLNRHMTILTGPNASGKSCILYNLWVKSGHGASEYVNFKEAGLSISWAIAKWAKLVREFEIDGVFKSVMLELFRSGPYRFDSVLCEFYHKANGEPASYREMHIPFLQIVGLCASAYMLQRKYSESLDDGKYTSPLSRITLIADQPAMGLDVTRTKMVIRSLKKIAPDVRFVFTTHSPAFICDNWENNLDILELKPIP